MILRLEEIERKVWEEEKLFLMKQVGILLIKNNAIKFGDYILAFGKEKPLLYRPETDDLESDHHGLDRQFFDADRP